jgi:hypothetical protein
MLHHERRGSQRGKKGVRGAPAAPLAREQKEGGLWKGIGNPEADAVSLSCVHVRYTCINYAISAPLA